MPTGRDAASALMFEALENPCRALAIAILACTVIGFVSLAHTSHD